MTREQIRDILLGEMRRVTELIEAKGATIEHDIEQIAQYAAVRADHLASIAGEDGFDQAADAEAQAVAMFAGLQAVSAADDADEMIRLAWVEAVRSGISIVAQVLATII